MTSVHFIYNQSNNDTTIGNYLFNACRRVGISCGWSNKTCLPSSAGDLLIKVDDGDYDDTPYKNLYDYPTAWWFIDSHTVFDRGLDIARNFDYTFCAQYDGYCKLKERGVDAYWLPCACEPTIHTSLAKLSDRPYDIGFAGSFDNSWNKGRKDLLHNIEKEFDNVLFSETNIGQLSIVNGSCKIIINHCVNNDINMRYFEAIGSGAILITPEIKGNGYDKMEKFPSIIQYDGTVNDAIRHIKNSIDSYADYQEDVKKASEFYKENHSYNKRLSRIMKVIRENESVKNQEAG